jgi:hypothetical protein
VHVCMYFAERTRVALGIGAVWIKVHVWLCVFACAICFGSGLNRCEEHPSVHARAFPSSNLTLNCTFTYACVCYTAMRRVYLILTSARGMCACKRADKKFHSCAYTHACTCVCVCMCVCLCACVCVCVCVYVLVCAHVYEYAYTHKPVFDSVCTHIHTLTVQTQIHIHTKQWGLCVYVTAWCVYVCIFMHIHTYM